MDRKETVVIQEYLRRLFRVPPPLSGLELILEETKAGNLSVEDAAERIRKLQGKAPWPPYFPALLRLVGVLFALFGVCMGIYTAYSSFGATEVPGTVVEMDGGPAIVEYHVDGKRFTHHSTFSSNPPMHHVGDEVVMLYDPAEPGHAQINEFQERWMFPLVFFGGGLLAIAISFGMSRGLIRVFVASTFAFGPHLTQVS